MKGVPAIVESILKGRFSMLLASLALLFLISPLIPGDQGFVDKVFGAFILLVLASCLRAISQSRRFLVFMVVFTVFNLGIGSFEMFTDLEPHEFRSLVLVVRTVYFLVVFFGIMHSP